MVRNRSCPAVSLQRIPLKINTNVQLESNNERREPSVSHDKSAQEFCCESTAHLPCSKVGVRIACTWVILGSGSHYFLAAWRKWSTLVLELVSHKIHSTSLRQPFMLHFWWSSLLFQTEMIRTKNNLISSSPTNQQVPLSL